MSKVTVTDKWRKDKRRPDTTRENPHTVLKEQGTDVFMALWTFLCLTCPNTDTTHKDAHLGNKKKYRQDLQRIWHLDVVEREINYFHRDFPDES